MNSLLLNYNDVCIYSSDLELLENKTAWLNDTCLHYQLERISYHHQQQRHHNKHKNHFHVTFLDPSIVSFLVHQHHQEQQLDCFEEEEDKESYYEECINFQKSWLEEENTSIHSSLSLSSSSNNISLIFVPINDDYASINNNNNNNNQPRGNHWSLLLVIVLKQQQRQHDTTNKNHNDDNHSKKDDESSQRILYFFHIDSMMMMTYHGQQSNNLKAATITAKQIQFILSIHPNHSSTVSTTTTTTMMTTTTYTNTNIAHHSNKSPQLMECLHVPQQTNGYDCGLCTLAFIEILIQEIDTVGLITIGKDDYNNKKDPNVWKEWIEQTLSRYVKDKYNNNVNKLTQTLRNNMIQDIYHLSSLKRNQS